MVSPPAALESVQEATTFTPKMLTRRISLSLGLSFMRTMTPGLSTTTSACWRLMEPSAWENMSKLLDSPMMERNTRKEPPALSPAGEPPPKAEAWPQSCRRWMSPLCLTTTAGILTARTTLLTPWSALDLTREARTPVRVTPVAHSCAEISSPELFLGDMDVLRLDTPVSTLRLLTLWAG